MTLKQIMLVARTRLQKVPPISLLVLAAVLYAILHRTAEDFLEQSFPIAVFLVIISYGFFLMRWSIFGLPKISIHIFLLPVLYLPVLVILCTVVYYGIWVALRDSYVWLQQQSPSRSLYVALTGILVLAIGYALFVFRLHARFFFGLTEALVGVLIALRNVPTKADPVLWDSDIYVVMLTASVFLIVRGFDNMHTGLKSEPGDAILKSFEASEYGSFLKSKKPKNNES